MTPNLYAASIAHVRNLPPRWVFDADGTPIGAEPRFELALTVGWAFAPTGAAAIAEVRGTLDNRFSQDGWAEQDSTYRQFETTGWLRWSAAVARYHARRLWRSR